MTEERTPCEEYGHNYEDIEGRPGWRYCRDCGDKYYDGDES